MFLKGIMTEQALKTDSERTQENISKSLENPLLDAVKTEDLTSTMKKGSQKKKLLPDQIPPSLDRFENHLSKKRQEG